MASIRPRGPLQWEVRIRRKGYPQQFKTFETKIAAQQWARAIERAMDTGQYVPDRASQRVTFEELCDRYETEVSALKKVPRAGKIGPEASSRV